MPNLTAELVYHQHLPHIQSPGATLFTTFRLAGSIPVAVAAALCEEAERVQAEMERAPDSPERAERLHFEERRFFGQWDAALDLGRAPTGCAIR